MENMDKAVFIVESLKRKLKQLYQTNKLTTFHYYEHYTPRVIEENEEE